MTFNEIRWLWFICYMNMKDRILGLLNRSIIVALFGSLILGSLFLSIMWDNISKYCSSSWAWNLIFYCSNFNHSISLFLKKKKKKNKDPYQRDLNEWKLIKSSNLTAHTNQSSNSSRCCKCYGSSIMKGVSSSISPFSSSRPLSMPTMTLES